MLTGAFPFLALLRGTRLDEEAENVQHRKIPGCLAVDGRISGMEW